MKCFLPMLFLSMFYVGYVSAADHFRRVADFRARVGSVKDARLIGSEILQVRLEQKSHKDLERYLIEYNSLTPHGLDPNEVSLLLRTNTDFVNKLLPLLKRAIEKGTRNIELENLVVQALIYQRYFQKGETSSFAVEQDWENYRKTDRAELKACIMENRGKPISEVLKGVVETLLGFGMGVGISTRELVDIEQHIHRFLDSNSRLIEAFKAKLLQIEFKANSIKARRKAIDQLWANPDFNDELSMAESAYLTASTQLFISTQVSPMLKLFVQSK